MTSKLVLVVLMFLSVTLCQVILARPAQQSTVDQFHFAQQFVSTLFPDLSGRHYVLTVESWLALDRPEPLQNLVVFVGTGRRDEDLGYTTGGCMGAVVTSPVAPKETPSSAGKPSPPISKKDDCIPSAPHIAHPQQFLTGAFQFDKSGAFTGFAAEGAAVGNHEAASAFARTVAGHPEMTDSEVVTALKLAGAKYGPADKREFVEHLPIAALEKFIGKLEILSVEFTPLNEYRPSVALGAWPDWRVRASARRPDGTAVVYEMTFDQFR